MGKRRLSGKYSAILLVPLSGLLIFMASGRPEQVEILYSEAIYPPIGKLLSRVSGLIPLSIAEITVVLAPLAFIAYIIWLILKSFGRGSFQLAPLLDFAVNMLVIAGIIFFSFVSLWGLNYYRQPFADITGMQVKPASVEELEGLCRSLIDRANALRQKVSVDEEGYVDIPGSTRSILRNCQKGYDEIAGRYPQLAGSYGDPKPVLLSGLMNYTGICGVYFPFTGEANVNISIPEATLPSTASHEMAHQRGFSREDEANYISYLACTSHPDTEFRYSGVLLALINSMNALYHTDTDLHSELSEGYSDAVRKDLTQINDFWKRYEGPVERTSNRINNTYLKANNQKDGVQSYGRMVDLLIAEYRETVRQ